MLFYILWSIVVLYLNGKAATFAKKRALSLQNKPLPDILHDVLPKIYHDTPDYLLWMCILYAAFFKCDVATGEVLRLLCSMSLRPIFICLTTFPTCCDFNKNNKSFYGQLVQSTHDLMFSGHTCCFLFLGNVIKGYGIIRYLFPLTLIAARQHYTIDVVVAILVYHFIPIIIP